MCTRKVGTLTSATVAIVAFYILMEFGYILIIIATVINYSKNKPGISNYLHNLGIACDDIGGTILYWTTRLKAYEGDTTHLWIEKAVDKLFGPDHCRCIARQEGLISV